MTTEPRVVTRNMGKSMDIASKSQVVDKEGDTHIDSDTSNNPVPGMQTTLEETIAAIKNSLDDLLPQ